MTSRTTPLYPLWDTGGGGEGGTPFDECYIQFYISELIYPEHFYTSHCGYFHGVQAFLVLIYCYHCIIIRSELGYKFIWVTSFRLWTRHFYVYLFV